MNKLSVVLATRNEEANMLLTNTQPTEPGKLRKSWALKFLKNHITKSST
ncbi:MAG: hypothetical protein UT96_C0002G0010 [Candidatus Woesebacteria bacterium GW2011_GWC2_40_30]|nr:MAG: hypothetical protein UT96_C0002G0010 [Candidatus Woesebacteria bacterium GW2011_GWC2_40_30]